MLRSLALTVEDVGRNRSRTSMSNLDTKVSRLGHASWATEGPTEHVAAVVEDNVEYDLDNLRSGLQRVLKKSHARIPKVAEVEESTAATRIVGELPIPGRSATLARRTVPDLKSQELFGKDGGPVALTLLDFLRELPE